MKYLLWILAAMGMVGCAGTQTGAAFTPRHSAYHYSEMRPNQAEAHEENLLLSLDRATYQQECLDRIDYDWNGTPINTHGCVK